MPIYEYGCLDCSHQWETLQKVDAPPPANCPGCNAGRPVRKVSAASFRLRGGGWYETDFKQERRRNLSGDQETVAAGAQKGSGESATAGDKQSASSGDGDRAGGKEKVASSVPAAGSDSSSQAS